MNIVTTAVELEKLCNRIDHFRRFAIDLEFIPERTYYPVLCLVQVATDEGAWLIDPIILKDLNLLWQRVADPNILVVLHAGTQDLELIYNLSGMIPHNIFDTQLAAGFTGCGYPIGYGKLLRQLLDITIAKTESFTDWQNRPLTESQIEYALDDVCHLLPMYDSLASQLKQIGRYDWAYEECKKYEIKERYVKESGFEFLRIKGASSLHRRGLAILQALCQWRENYARKLNKPVKSIVPDNILFELSRRPPKAVKDIERIRGIRSDQLKAHGEQWLTAIQTGVEMEDSQCPSWPSSRTPPKKEVLIADLLFAMLKVFVQSADVATELVITRDEMQSLVRAFREDKLKDSELPVLQGWRLDIAGKKVIDLLNGAPLTMSFDIHGETPVRLISDVKQANS